MRVRRAGRGDLVSIGRVADAAAWEAYSGLLKPDTIARMLARDYSPSSIRRRLLHGGIRVAEDERLGVVGFADATVEEGRLHLLAVSAEPGHHAGDIGRSLLAAVREDHADLPVAADVILGDLAGERLYEYLGFVPGEVIERSLFEEDVVERRWWLLSSDEGSG